jgi:hypothetical protein
MMTKELNHQLRYVSFAKKILDYKPVFETIDRKFVSIPKLSEYIHWINNKIGQKQLQKLQKYVQNSNLSAAL